ncbi:hypothetical protein J6590_010452 [Homalodisca vitripennis]|nr:hypothetical protein J6590_010452 [Homalodisca vitripennis]
MTVDISQDVWCINHPQGIICSKANTQDTSTSLVRDWWKGEGCPARRQPGTPLIDLTPTPTLLHCHCHRHRPVDVNKPILR